ASGAPARSRSSPGSTRAIGSSSRARRTCATATASRWRATTRPSRRVTGRTGADRMLLSEASVRRPVFVTVISLLLVIFGLMSLQRLSVREYPDIDRPVVSITTNYNGASAAVIETKITQVIEDSIAGIEGILKIESDS